MKVGQFLLLALGMTFLLPGNAHAYIDPGSGAIVWQVLISAFFGLCFYVKRTRDWIVGGIKKVIGRGKKDDVK